MVNPAAYSDSSFATFPLTDVNSFLVSVTFHHNAEPQKILLDSITDRKRKT